MPDEKDDFTYFQASVTELLRDVIFIVGSLNSFADVSEGGREGGKECGRERG